MSRLDEQILQTENVYKNTFQAVVQQAEARDSARGAKQVWTLNELQQVKPDEADGEQKMTVIDKILAS